MAHISYVIQQFSYVMDLFYFIFTFKEGRTLYIICVGII